MFEPAILLINCIMKKIIILLSACFLMLSCAKENTTYKAIITVKTLNGIPIPNANLKLYVPVDPSNEFFTQTDENGQSEFEVPAKAYYDIKTWRGTFRGCGYVEFIEGETVEQTVFIRTFGDPLNSCFD